MSYTLFGSQRSPFVRACRMLMLQNSIPFDFQVLNFLEDASDARTLAKETPINKVPILIDGEQKIFDSRVIVNFLIKKHGLHPLSLDEENLVSVVYSCLDTGVILFLMKRDGFDINGPGFFLSRQRARIPDNLDFLKSWVANLDPAKSQDWNYASMALYSFLYWGQARGILEISHYPEMGSFLERFKNAPGVQQTTF